MTPEQIREMLQKPREQLLVDFLAMEPPPDYQAAMVKGLAEILYELKLLRLMFAMVHGIEVEEEEHPVEMPRLRR